MVAVREANKVDEIHKVVEYVETITHRMSAFPLMPRVRFPKRGVLDIHGVLWCNGPNKREQGSLT